MVTADEDKDPFLRKVRLPGERFWKGLVAINWETYRRTLHAPNRPRAMERAQQMLILSSQRLLVFYDGGEPEPSILAFPLDKLRNLSVVHPPGTLPWRKREGMIRFEAPSHEEWVLWGWTVPRPIAVGFVSQMRENISTLTQGH